MASTTNPAIQIKRKILPTFLIFRNQNRMTTTKKSKQLKIKTNKKLNGLKNWQCRQAKSSATNTKTLQLQMSCYIIKIVKMVKWNQKSTWPFVNGSAAEEVEFSRFRSPQPSVRKSDEHSFVESASGIVDSFIFPVEMYPLSALQLSTTT